MHRLNQIITTLLLLTVVIAAPAAALGWAAGRTWQRPSSGDVRAWIGDPPPGAALLALVLSAAACLWLLAAIAITRATAYRVRRAWRRLRHLPLPTPAQATASSLAGTALLTLPAITTAPADTNPGSSESMSQLHPGPPDTPNADRAPGHGPPAVDGHRGTAGVDLPDGGWLPPHTAQNIAAMAGLFWLRRRQTYQPAIPSDHDVAPVLPAAVQAAAAAYPDPAGGPLPSDRLPTGHLHLSGPGAHAAARGLLVSTLMTNTISAPRGHVIISPSDLDLLLGPTPAHLTRLNGLHITDNPDDFLQDLRTSPPHDDHGAAPAPRVLHLTGRRSGTPPTTTAVPGVALSTVTFGATATADATWHVNSDGTLTSTPEPSHHLRLCVLSAATALDLLSLIGQAHGLTEPIAAAPAEDPDPRRHQPADVPPPSAVGTTPVQLRVLGDCRLTVHGTTVTIGRSAAWQILVLLAVQPDGATSRQLIETIWPGLPPSSISNRLYTTLHDLRTSLQPLLDAPLIVRHANRYKLDPARADVDLWHLQAAARTAAQALATTDRRTAQHAVVEHYGGELAAAHSWPWLAGPRETIRRHVVDAFTDLADALPPRDAVDLLTEAITVDPYNDDLHRRAITALTDAGDHPAAARLHRTYLDRITAAGLYPGPGMTDPGSRTAPRTVRST